MALKPYEQVAFDVIGRWHSRRITSPPRDGRQPSREGIPTLVVVIAGKSARFRPPCEARQRTMRRSAQMP